MANEPGHSTAQNGSCANGDAMPGAWYSGQAGVSSCSRSEEDDGDDDAAADDDDDDCAAAGNPKRGPTSVSTVCARIALTSPWFGRLAGWLPSGVKTSRRHG